MRPSQEVRLAIAQQVNQRVDARGAAAAKLDAVRQAMDARRARGQGPAKSPFLDAVVGYDTAASTLRLPAPTAPAALEKGGDGHGKQPGVTGIEKSIPSGERER